MSERLEKKIKRNIVTALGILMIYPTMQIFTGLPISIGMAVKSPESRQEVYKNQDEISHRFRNILDIVYPLPNYIISKYRESDKKK